MVSAAQLVAKVAILVISLILFFLLLIAYMGLI